MDKAVQPALAGKRVLYERRRPEETTLYVLTHSAAYERHHSLLLDFG